MMGYRIGIGILLYTMLVINGCTPRDENYVYLVTRLSKPIKIDGDWNKEFWRNIPSLKLNNYMGDPPEHKPNVEVKVAYDEEAIYVIFRVEDQYVRCTMDQYQDPVSRDSAVEFFFAPNKDISKGYFNLEVNCGGTALFKFQKKARKGQKAIPRSSFNKIDLAHSLPRTVDPEIQEKVTWTIEYRIPVEILLKYHKDVEYPAPGVEWRANFYKIADKSSQPHWLTWSQVDHPTPQFHLPEFFGTLEFN
jgi:hypothetical protein